MKTNDSGNLSDGSALTSHSDDAHSQSQSTSTGEFAPLKVQSETKKEYLFEDKIYGNDLELAKPWKMGKLITLLYLRGNPMIVIGPDCIYKTSSSIVFLSLYLFSIVNCVFFLEYFLLYPLTPQFMHILGTVAYVAQIISHFLTSLMNPGIPPRSYHASNYQKSGEMEKYANKKTNPYKFCSACNIVVPETLQCEHCESCDICIEGNDHHCVWTGKCIGKYNLIPFYAFVASTLVFIMSAFLGFIFALPKL